MHSYLLSRAPASPNSETPSSRTWLGSTAPAGACATVGVYVYFMPGWICGKYLFGLHGRRISVVVLIIRLMLFFHCSHPSLLNEFVWTFSVLLVIMLSMHRAPCPTCLCTFSSVQDVCMSSALPRRSHTTLTNTKLVCSLVVTDGMAFIITERLGV